MALLETSIFNWRTLTGIQNNILKANTFLHALLFQETRNFAGDLAELSLLSGDRQVMPFVKKGSAAQLIKGLGSEVRQYKFPTIRMKMEFNAAKYLREADAGVIAAVQGADQAALIDSAESRIQRDMEWFDRHIQNAIEWMCGRVLTGTLTYGATQGATEETDAFEVVFGRSAGNLLEASAGDEWNHATTAKDPAIMIRAGKQRLNAVTGQNATHLIMGKNVGAAFVANASVVSNLDIRRLNQAGPLELAGGQIIEGATFEGTYGGVECWTYDRTVDILAPDLSVALNDTDIIDPDSAYLVSVPNARETFAIHYGGIEDWEAMSSGRLAMTRFAKSWSQDDPSSQFQLVETRPLPHTVQVDGVVELQPLV